MVTWFFNPSRWLWLCREALSLSLRRRLKNAASFEEIAEAMGELIAEGKLRGWGMCNDNAYGLTASCYAARSVVGSLLLQSSKSS